MTIDLAAGPLRQQKPEPSVPYRYYKWLITAANGDVNAQASEFYFLNSSGEVPIISISGAGYAGETPDMLDDRTYSKWVGSISALASNPVIFDLGVATEVESYLWEAGPDTLTRTPKDWTFEGSNDLSSWSIISTVSGYSENNYRYSASRAFETLNAAPSGPGYRFYSLNCSANRGTQSVTQMGELKVFSGGVLQSVISGITSGAPVATSSEAGNKLSDGTSSKTTYLSSPPVRFTLMMDQRTVIDSYEWITAADSDTRDPVVWTFEGSNDHYTWTVLDTQAPVVPTARSTSVGVFPL